MSEITISDTIQQCFLQQKSAFLTQPYRSYVQRINDLKTLKNLVLKNQQAFITAMSEDFGHRSQDDSLIGDILTTVQGINYSLKHLKRWMKPKSCHVGILFQPASAKVLYQPLGVVGIIAPWNYPLFLSLGPLTAALSAGNNAMIKMSEFTPATSALLAKLLDQHFPQHQVAIVAGDANIAAEFSSINFDHLFYTGSTQVGKLVMAAAANNLTSVTLELGGKSPAIIDENIDIDVAVSRFILGKTLNSGQTCVAPDYVLCPESKVEQLTLSLKRHYQTMYPTIAKNNDCTAVVNERQFERVMALLDDAKAKSATIIPLVGEPIDKTLRKMPLTLLTNVDDSMAIMQEEIFGPLLPIVPYKTLNEALNYINKRQRPLALYLYSFDRATQQTILANTHSGGVCINDAASHVATDDLPFGGVGHSGMGQYHGEEGFLTFSHAKSVFKRGRISFAHLLFPPFGKAIHRLIYRLFIR